MTHYLFTIALLPPAVFALFWAVKRKKHTGMAAGFWFDMFLVTLGVCALLAVYPLVAALLVRNRLPARLAKEGEAG